MSSAAVKLVKVCIPRPFLLCTANIVSISPYFTFCVYPLPNAMHTIGTSIFIFFSPFLCIFLTQISSAYWFDWISHMGRIHTDDENHAIHRRVYQGAAMNTPESTSQKCCVCHHMLFFFFLKDQVEGRQTDC